MAGTAGEAEEVAASRHNGLRRWLEAYIAFEHADSVPYFISFAYCKGRIHRGRTWMSMVPFCLQYTYTYSRTNRGEVELGGD